ncbi:MAG: ATP-binding protein [Limosilactobacillus sp.]|jgi:predicted AAA+ superfamily ATPase|uniref:ATP-binding protein n=1 Tax=Limosilactobacillus sp. TaxID=2773925 RepID=UPI0025BC2BE7|nr:ATP-binding protein [Limosilactobacillus sp.]MCI1974770.1 ATP-binding protein [Limosilactobacillus sp.]MCI2030967.1 ATP-binding protein [Limosilactobacillus sp.]
MLIKRPKYINFLNEFKDTEFVKVITGVRRSGKTYLMNMFIDELRHEGVPEEQIIHLNFESLQYTKIKGAMDLWKYVHSHEVKGKKNYLFFDEIQNVDEWERAINSFRVDMDADIYVTGSNSRLLSGELATLLAGRYVELTVYPISFAEYFTFRKGQSFEENKLFDEYLQFGGFPNSILAPSTSFRNSILQDIFNTIMYRDIALRSRVKNDRTIIAIAEYLMSEIGNPISANKIAGTLKAAGFKAQAKSVIDYLELLEDAFIFYKARRYDIRGKKWLQTMAKYYVVDTGLRNVQLNRSSRDNLGHVLENIVYIELLRRGYKVDVGSYDNKEIDFIARKGEEVEYYQVTLHIPEGSMRETDNLRFLPDGYPKTVLSLDANDAGMVNGIKIKYVLDWLLEENEN